MRILYVTYALWKSVAQANSFSTYHKVVQGNDRKLWCGDPEIIYATDVDNATDYTDWQTNFETESTAVPSEDEALGNIVGLGTPLQPRSEDGTPRVATQALTLGQERFLRLDNGTFRMAIDGRAVGTPVVLWNGTGAGDTGGDWSASGDGSETAGSAHSGTNGWDTGVAALNDKVRFDNGSLVDIAAGYAELRFWIQPKAIPPESRLRVGWLNDTNDLVGVRLRVDQYVTDLEVDEWQQIAIPIEDFGLDATVQQLELICRATAGQHYWYDDIEIAPVGSGPYRFRVRAPANERWHVTMLVLVISGDASGWTSTVFANLADKLDHGLICRQKRLSTGDDLWALNSRDNVDLFGRYHPQDDITFADDNLLVGLMLKPGKANIVITNDDVLDYIVRDDLSGIEAMRAFVHYGVEVIG